MNGTEPGRVVPRNFGPPSRRRRAENPGREPGSRIIGSPSRGAGRTRRSREPVGAIEIAIGRAFGQRLARNFRPPGETDLDLGQVRPPIRIDQHGIPLGPDVLLSAIPAFEGFRSTENKVEAVGVGLDAGEHAASCSRTANEYQSHPGGPVMARPRAKVPCPGSGSTRHPRGNRVLAGRPRRQAIE